MFTVVTVSAINRCVYFSVYGLKLAAIEYKLKCEMNAKKRVGCSPIRGLCGGTMILNTVRKSTSIAHHHLTTAIVCNGSTVMWNCLAGANKVVLCVCLPPVWLAQNVYESNGGQLHAHTTKICDSFKWSVRWPFSLSISTHIDWPQFCIQQTQTNIMKMFETL